MIKSLTSKMLIQGSLAYSASILLALVIRSNGKMKANKASLWNKTMVRQFLSN